MLANLVHTPGARHLLRQAPAATGQDASKPASPHPVPGTFAIPESECWQISSTRLVLRDWCQAPVDASNFFQSFPGP
jgi:hypothetical protein